MSVSLLFAASTRLASRRLTMPSSRIFSVRFASNEPAKQQYVYEYDKPASQRFIEKRTDEVKKFAKFLDADHGTPIWWKTTFDKMAFVGLGALATALLLNAAYSMFLYVNGKL